MKNKLIIVMFVTLVLILSSCNQQTNDIIPIETESGQKTMDYGTTSDIMPDDSSKTVDPEITDDGIQTPTPDITIDVSPTPLPGDTEVLPPDVDPDHSLEFYSFEELSSFVESTKTKDAYEEYLSVQEPYLMFPDYKEALKITETFKKLPIPKSLTSMLVYYHDGNVLWGEISFEVNTERCKITFYCNKTEEIVLENYTETDITKDIGIARVKIYKTSNSDLAPYAASFMSNGFPIKLSFYLEDLEKLTLSRSDFIYLSN